LLLLPATTLIIPGLKDAVHSRIDFD